MQNTPADQKAAACQFVEFWQDKGYEKGQTQPFWLSLLRVLGVERPETAIEFEDKAHIDAAHGFIDGYIPETHVLVEQKSLGKNLRAAIPQSDGSLLTPFQQAKRYAVDLPYSRRPRWVVTCNFAEFLIYDMERPNAEPESLLLENLPDELHRLRFLVDTASDTIRHEEEISKRAGDVVGQIYDALLKQYRDPSNPESLKSLNELCVRIVFLLYAEDADVFRHLQFHDYLAKHRSSARSALIDLFRVLDTPPEKRDPYLDADLAAFPYVNGGLFANEHVEIPQFTEEIIDLILHNGSENFDWKDISPTIFGAVFESTLNPETRRSGGMHYTSVANIHKVIDPLFLDGLKTEFANAKAIADKKARENALRSFCDRLASKTFLDPACGSGNFLTETYISLRRLENEALATRLGKEKLLDLDGDLVKVSLSQFHGIEINDFAVKVAKTALWIAENQMLRETEAIAHRNLDFLPLKNYDGIVEGNALRLDWPRADYTIGNPPFIGARLMSPEQKDDLETVFGKDWKGLGNLDYVAGWYRKAADGMEGSAALVSTNSVTQGDAVATLWKPLVGRGVSIDFAHRTFRWDSESNSKAHVHCVIIGFHSGGAGGPPANGTTRFQRVMDAQDAHPTNAGEPPAPRQDAPMKPIFDGERVSYVPHINAYLLPAPDVFVESRSRAISALLPLVFGSMPNDGGFLSDWSPERRAEVIARWPEAAPLFRRLTGSQEYINGIERWCLWLKGANPALIRTIPPVMEAVAAVREMRLASKRAATRKLADTPTLFGEIRQPESGNYLIIPKVSSERRRYVPMGFLPADVIASDLALIVPNATLYHFGVLTSNVHMAWMRAVAGRLKSDYRYSAQIVYNNFPWPEETAADIAATAQAILDARAKYPDSTLADLYDELAMPPDLRRAHQENDRAVMAAYGFSTKMTESECVAELFRRYQALVDAKGISK